MIRRYERNTDTDDLEVQARDHFNDTDERTLVVEVFDGSETTDESPGVLFLVTGDDAHGFDDDEVAYLNQRVGATFVPDPYTTHVDLP